MANEWINNKLEDIEDKVEIIDTKLDNIISTQIEQASDIKHHIARTDRLQEIVEPLHLKYQQVVGGMKVLAIIGALVGFAKLVLELFSLL